MVHEKGLAEDVADKIGVLVKLHGAPFELLETLRSGPLAGDTLAMSALDELELLFGYLEAMGALRFISFDLSLARGLDYYTGVIYEAVLSASRCVVVFRLCGVAGAGVSLLLFPLSLPCLA